MSCVFRASLNWICAGMLGECRRHGAISCHGHCGRAACCTATMSHRILTVLASSPGRRCSTIAECREIYFPPPILNSSRYSKTPGFIICAWARPGQPPAIHIILTTRTLTACLPLSPGDGDQGHFSHCTVLRQPRKQHSMCGASIGLISITLLLTTSRTVARRSF